MTLALSQEMQGKYELLAKIKEGGMGAVYKVRHRELGDLRVIKVIRAQYSTDEGAQKRFIREARAASRLRHPNIVLLYDFTVDEADRAYMVMEFIEGVTLRELVTAEGAPTLDLSLEIARQALRALAFLHQHAYVHRDISPDNLMLTRDTLGDPLIKLIDLGIVKHMEDTHAELTGFGAFVGKIKYSSPEQWSGGKVPVDTRSDLYSFGVMLYELLTGRFPFPGAKVADLMWAHRFLPPLSFDQTDPQRKLPPPVRKLVLRALEKDPGNRPSTAEALLDLLDRMGSRQHLRRDVERTLSTTFPIAVAEAGAPGDSTQGRVDRQFVMGPTPRPDTESSSSPEATGRVAQLLAEAERLDRRGKLKEARRRLYRALSIEPDHGIALGMLRSVEAALQQEAEAALAVAKQVEENAAAIADYLAAGRLEEASQKLAAARDSLGENARFEALDAELQAARVRAERERALVEAVQRVQEEVRAESIESAGAELARARAELGTDPRFDRLDSDLAGLRERLDARRREELARELQAIDAALREERIDDVAAALAATRARFEEAATDLDGYADRLARLRSELELRARESAIASRIDEVKAALATQEIEAGRERLAAARSELGDDRRFAELDSEIVRLEAVRAERERRDRIEGLLQQAKAHAENADIAAAMLALETLLGLEPGHVEAGELLEAQLLAGQRLVEERQRHERLLASAREIETHLAGEQADVAERALREAGSVLGNDPLLEDLAERIAALRRDLEARRAAEEKARTRARVDDLVAAAQLLAHDDLAAAIGRLEEAASLDSGETWVPGLLESYRDELATRRRRAAVAAACAAIEAHLEREDLDAALETLVAARAETRADPAFDAAERRIAEMRDALDLRRRQQEEAATRERAASLLGQARTAAADESFEQALELAQAALALVPDDGGARELVAHCRQAIDAREELRRHERTASAIVARSRALAAHGRLDEAVEVLDQSQRDHGELPGVAELRAALETRQRLLAAERLLADARRLAQEGDLAAAIAVLEERPRVDAGNQEAAELLLAYQERAREEQARREALRQRVEAIAACISREDAGEAAALLEGARAEHGDDPALQTAAARIAQLAETLEERRRRNQAIEAAVSSVGEALDARRVDQAAELIERCRETHGPDAALDELERRVAATRVELEAERRREERARRRSDAEGLVTAARGLAAAGDLEASIHQLAAALTILPEDARIWGLLDSYRSEIEARRRHDAITEAVEVVESHLGNGNAEAATRALAAARAELGEFDAIGALQQRLLDLRVELEARRRIVAETERMRLAESRLVTAETSAARGDFDGAVREVEMALEIDRRAPRARDLLERYQQARKLAVVERKQAEIISKAATKIERAIDKGKLKQAERKLRRSLEKYGVTETLLKLSARLEGRSGPEAAGADSGRSTPVNEESE